MQYEMRDPQLSKKLVPKTAKTRLGVVEYVDVGTGPAIVSLHGAMGGYDQSLILAQAIGDTDYRYLCLSRPGYLGTSLAEGRRPEQQGDLIAALLRGARYFPSWCYSCFRRWTKRRSIWPTAP